MNTKHLFGHTRSWQKYLLVQKYFLPLPLPRVEALTGGGPRWAVAARQPVEWYWPDMGLIEGTPGQGTFTSVLWLKLAQIYQKAYLCWTWLFCQFQCCSAQFGQLEADKSVSPPGLCPPGDGGHWQWSSGQWSVGSSLKVRFPPQQLSTARCQARPHPNHWQSSFPIQSLLFCSMYISWTRFRCSSDCIVC